MTPLPASQRAFIEQQLGRLNSLESLPVRSSNLCLKAVAGGRSYFIKYFNAAVAHENLQNEFTALDWAAKQGLALPEIALCKTLRLAIFPFVEQPDLAHLNAPKSYKIKRLANALKHLHQSPKKAPNIIQQRLEHDLKTTAFACEQHLPKTLIALAQKLDGNQDSLRVCHGDASFANLLCAQNSHFIDWEYARLAPVEYDLASSICINHFSPRDQEEFIDAYTKDLQQPLNPSKIAEYLSIFQILNQLWYKGYQTGYTSAF